MPKKPTPKPEQILPALGSEARKLFSILWKNGLISDDVALSLAQYTASATGDRLTPEQVLLCVVSDYMAPLIRRGAPPPAPRNPVLKP